MPSDGSSTRKTNTQSYSLQSIHCPSLGDFGCLEPINDDQDSDLPDDIAVNLKIESSACSVGALQLENLIFDFAIVHTEAEMRQKEKEYETIKQVTPTAPEEETETKGMEPITYVNAYAYVTVPAVKASDLN